jgi:hypothetical protein
MNRGGSLPPSHSTNADHVVENSAGTGAIEGQEGPTLSWLNDLKSHQQRMHDPEDNDDAEYTAENEKDVEVRVLDTLHTKSSRISKQSKRAQEAMSVIFPSCWVTYFDIHL